MLREAMSATGASAALAVCVGDNHHDAAAAAEAEVRFIAERQFFERGEDGEQDRSRTV
jgi:phosphoglycolate phosphatase-like HAD superfamily hydrolase